MRYSRLLIPTLKEDPADAEIASHRFMMRSGMIRQVNLLRAIEIQEASGTANVNAAEEIEHAGGKS